jgi:16S rRNA (adenine1518-N6/adenine1519-N6)-dimethyltransferase
VEPDSSGTGPAAAPRKRFGQHFLHDRGVVAKILAAVDPRRGDDIVEIGPGLGALTAPLLERVDRLHVVEIDRNLARHLRGAHPPDRLAVHEGDALEFDFGALPAGLRVVGNLPYNISTPLLFRLAAFAPRLRDLHFMLQKEVVERMAAAPGGKDYGRLSVMLQWRYAIEPVLEVPPEAFDPPPRVDSAVVRMVPVEGVAVDAALLGEIVACAFSQRRKILRATLGRWLEARGAAGGFDLQRRAEEVPVAEYLALARSLTPR